MRLTLDEVLKRIEERNPGKFEITENLQNYEYKNVHQKIKVKCKKCGNEYYKRINDLFHGYGCNKCANVKRYTVDEMKKRVHEYDCEYILVSDTSRTRDTAIFKHLKCGNEFPMILNNFINNNHKCPFCNNSLGNSDSKGIKKIKSILEKNSIKYEQEKQFLNCTKNGKYLPFDLYLIEKNTLIEFDGIQHYEPVEIFGGEERFIRCQENDKIKNKFAEDNNIKLIRIPYNKEKEIEKILKDNNII